MRTLLEILLLGSPLFCWANDLGPIPSEYMAFDEDQGSGICLSQEVEDQFCLGIPELGHFKRQAEAKCAWEALPAQPCLEEEGNLVGNNRKRSKDKNGSKGLSEAHSWSAMLKVGADQRMCVARELGWANQDNEIDYEQMKGDLEKTRHGHTLAEFVEFCKEYTDTLNQEEVGRVLAAQEGPGQEPELQSRKKKGPKESAAEEAAEDLSEEDMDNAKKLLFFSCIQRGYQETCSVELSALVTNVLEDLDEDGSSLTPLEAEANLETEEEEEEEEEQN